MFYDKVEKLRAELQDKTFYKICVCSQAFQQQVQGLLARYGWWWESDDLWLLWQKSD